MIEIETTCRICGREHSPTHEDYVRGQWHTCTACRDGPESSGATGHDDQSQSLKNDATDSKITEQKENES